MGAWVGRRVNEYCVCQCVWMCMHVSLRVYIHVSVCEGRVNAYKPSIYTNLQPYAPTNMQHYNPSNLSHIHYPTLHVIACNPHILPTFIGNENEKLIVSVFRIVSLLGGVYCPPENLQHWEVAKTKEGGRGRGVCVLFCLRPNLCVGVCVCVCV